MISPTTTDGEGRIRSEIEATSGDVLFVPSGSQAAVESSPTASNDATRPLTAVVSPVVHRFRRTLSPPRPPATAAQAAARHRTLRPRRSGVETPCRPPYPL